MELDANFRKALYLLHSKTEEAAIQLKQMLDDAIAKKLASLKEKAPVSPKVESDVAGKAHLKGSPREELSAGLSADARKNAEKRQLERARNDSPVHETKRIKTEHLQEFAYEVPSSSVFPKSEPFSVKKGDDDTDSSDGNADDFAMEMGLACIICKQVEVSLGNQLVECQECHNLYHQECHRPPATGYDANDPRSVWYCAKCTKNMKKMASKTQKTSKTSASVLCKDTVSQSRNVKHENVSQTVLLPFKRTELKAPSSQGNSASTTNKPIGLAGLAANLSRSTTTSISSATSSTRTTSSKTISSCPTKSKTFGPFSSFPHPSAKNVNPASSSSSSSKMQSAVTSSSVKTSSSNSHVLQPPSIISVSAVAKGNSSPSNSASKSSVSTTSSITSASSRSGSSNNGSSGGMAAGGAKPASSSSLMSADKRLQIMKKKAAKMQEKRRLSSK